MTINPAITFGIARDVGSIEVGKIADIVLWRPEFFGVKAQQVFKAGAEVWSPFGTAAASVSMSEPLVYREAWPACGGAPDRVSFLFVHPLAIESGLDARLGLDRRLLPATGTRHLSKKDMVRNDALPHIEVDPDTSKSMPTVISSTSLPSVTSPSPGAISSCDGSVNVPSRAPTSSASKTGIFGLDSCAPIGHRRQLHLRGDSRRDCSDLRCLGGHRQHLPADVRQRPPGARFSVCGHRRPAFRTW